MGYIYIYMYFLLTSKQFGRVRLGVEGHEFAEKIEVRRETRCCRQSVATLTVNSRDAR